MYKKGFGRGTFSDPSNKRGQITIFIILGLLILISFIFVYSLTSGIKKGQLQETQEKTLTKSFKKEALRIFVEDCLTDELEKGLIIIGKQGRLWNDQPGGTRQFEEGVTGTALGEERLFMLSPTTDFLNILMLTRAATNRFHRNFAGMHIQTPRSGSAL